MYMLNFPPTALFHIAKFFFNFQNIQMQLLDNSIKTNEVKHNLMKKMEFPENLREKLVK